VTNLTTPRTLFSPTYLLNLVKPEIAPFDLPIRKPHPRTKHRVNRMIRCGYLNFSRWRPSSHLGLFETGISAIRSADLENSTVQPNMKWIRRLAEIRPFEIFKIERSVGHWSSVGPQYILLLTLFSYTPLRCVRNVAREEQK